MGRASREGELARRQRDRELRAEDWEVFQRLTRTPVRRDGGIGTTGVYEPTQGEIDRYRAMIGSLRRQVHAEAIEAHQQEEDQEDMGREELVCCGALASSPSPVLRHWGSS